LLESGLILSEGFVVGVNCFSVVVVFSGRNRCFNGCLRFGSKCIDID
jgi:hypothetical protein